MTLNLNLNLSVYSDHRPVQPVTSRSFNQGRDLVCVEEYQDRSLTGWMHVEKYLTTHYTLRRTSICLVGTPTNVQRLVGIFMDFTKTLYLCTFSKDWLVFIFIKKGLLMSNHK